MTGHGSSDTRYLLFFFLMIISVGTALLFLPLSWAGPVDSSLSLVDSLFIATSAVCVTGLATVDVANFSRFGHVVILSLIQIGGLGIISFTSLIMLLPGHRLPYRRLRTIRGFSIDGVEHNPARIVRNIVLFTLSIETAGALALFPIFLKAGVGDSAFTAVFHSVSAFCNAGFSLFSTSMEAYNDDPLILGILSVLIVTGGIGFIVLQDIERRLRGKRSSLSDHSRLVLMLTGFLIFAGAAAFWFFENDRAFSGMGFLQKASNALFQSITPRTAGFNAVPQVALSQASKFLTIVLMFIGGAPGSIAGGIKVSTAFLVLLVMVRQPNDHGEINAFKRRLSPGTTGAAVTYFLRAGLLLLVATAALSLSEGARGTSLNRIIFEAVSAFGTVGLSLNLTAGLSIAGKLILVGTMYAGRVGLVALALPAMNWKNEHIVYPEAEVLVG
ncbi:MAG: hypothetical protein A2Y38_18140 [Spirochaetes bacterium GWB1_59_5]|nr:MAG: hypothetical protein A2Y38_18140 [Spirochaetes bacterium GWB1_59_5]